ncbi:SDR family oxidoreductase [Neorhizobium sp. DT-125]|uniref:SDR family oxidoreductase n=1 Tax=Neorhizobium sp. DT-125 TaxID=3396163 RepID=UPI003F1C7304
MDLEIKGKTALVLGGGGGLGSAIAVSLAREGANIAVADVDVDAAAAVSEQIEASDGKALSLRWDLSEIDTVEPNIRKIAEQLGSVDILVAITGGPPPGPIVGQPSHVWQTFFNSMVLSVFAIADAVIPAMSDKGWGRIITSTSSGVIAPIPGLGISNALRTSLTGWSKTLAGEVGSRGITSNVIVPGRILTKRIDFLDEKKAEREGRSVEDVRKQSTASIPAGRYGDPSEYADVVTFLASNKASYVNGSVIRVDGGYVPSI